ncbi:oxidoreductase [Salmonella enterica subsp. enterica]|uniref:Oxidoreductase n=1 Tax=Salmonella enterica I TaxID=59201 RepID=A0A447TW33_SALET|nr:oxidoreductase [Salmonella enterica subsp. enterica]
MTCRVLSRSRTPYSLLNRSYEVGLAEVSQYEGVELLAYSCLAFGTLTGKYLNGAKPAGARNTLFQPLHTLQRRTGAKKPLPPTSISRSVTILIRRRWRWPFVRRQPFCRQYVTGPQPRWAQLKTKCGKSASDR